VPAQRVPAPPLGPAFPQPVAAVLVVRTQREPPRPLVPC
jgi:hypothetical protein